MELFARRFGVDALQRSPTAWMRDLLRHWRPSGEQSGENGLRLAVRNGYLNFYRLGQSIAKVGLDRDGRPVGHVHWKYVWPNAHETPSSQYAAIRGDCALLAGLPPAIYQGEATLRAWIEQAEQHAGIEKPHVERLVATTPGVLDLEMGQPGTGYRVDLVELEEDSGGLWLRCVEVKCSKDKRVRTKGPRPEVLDQLDAYAKFIGQPTNAGAVQRAYAETARVLVALADLARGAGNPVQLDPLILRARTETLRIRPQIRLAVVCEGTDANWWAVHRPKLVDAGADLRDV